MKVKEEVGSINLIYEFCVQGGYTPWAWLPSDLASACHAAGTWLLNH